MKKAFLVASALLLQLSFLPLTAQALPEEKAVGKAATHYRHLDIAANRSKSSANGQDQVAQKADKPATAAPIAVESKTQPAVASTDAQPELRKGASTQASTAK